MLRLCSALASALARLWGILNRLPRQAATALGAAAACRAARPHRLWRAMLLILPLALVVAWAVPQINLVMSPSIEAWALRKSPGEIMRGDYVLFVLQHPVTGPKPVRITKHALCLPGDRLTMHEAPSMHASGSRDARYFCNGRFLARTLPVAHNGKKLDHLQWSGTIPAGMVYVGSPHPRGFDSRYFGLLPVASLTRMERIL
jgi:type IV secretory pathway protease TraF